MKSPKLRLQCLMVTAGSCFWLTALILMLSSPGTLLAQQSKPKYSPQKVNVNDAKKGNQQRLPKYTDEWPVPHSVEYSLWYFDNQNHFQHSKHSNCKACHVTGAEKFGPSSHGDAQALGFALRNADPVLRRALKLTDEQGVVIESVQEGSAAAESGFEAADVIVEADGKPVGETAVVNAMFTELESSKVDFKLYRDGESIRKAFEIGKFRDDVLYQFRIGVELAPLAPVVRAQLSIKEDQGILVQEVVAEYPAKLAGVQQFDVILRAGGKSLSTVQDVMDAVRESKDKPISFTILRKNAELTIEITPKRERVAVPEFRVGHSYPPVKKSNSLSYPHAPNSLVEAYEKAFQSQADAEFTELIQIKKTTGSPVQRGEVIATIGKNGQAKQNDAQKRTQKVQSDSARKIDRVLKELNELKAVVESLRED